MSGSPSAREEAERLVATVLAMAASGNSSGTREQVTAGLGSLADTITGLVGRLAVGPGSGPAAGSPATGHRPSTGWSTGSAECCVCPLCRAIAAVRDPSPETAARLATSAGDIASGMASLLRGFSHLAGDRPKPAARPAPAPNPDETWQHATRTPAPPNRPADAWSAATNPAAAATGPVTTPPVDSWSAATGAKGAPDGGHSATGAEDPSDGDHSATSATGAEDASDRSHSATSPTGVASTGVARPAEGAAGEFAADRGDPWAAASAADAVTAEAARVASRERRVAAQAARKAADEAARRVAEAAALATAAKAAATKASAAATKATAEATAAARAGSGDPAGEAPRDNDPDGPGTASRGGDETIDTSGRRPVSRRTSRGLDVWAAATSGAGVADVASPTTVDHDVPGAAASGKRDGAVGDAAPGDGAA